MALVGIERQSSLPVDKAWQRLTDWERHGQGLPFTTVIVRTPPPTGVGTVFVARTRFGRLHLDDPMQVVCWRPPQSELPGRCRVEKRGSLITGWAQLEVSPRCGGSSILWQEEIRVRKLPGVFDSLTGAVGRLLYGRLITRLLAEERPVD